jgi:hypothetical protein
MQQLVRINLGPETVHPAHMPSPREVLLGLLEDARDLARTGDLRAARLACAEAMFAQQPLLIGDRSLLAATIASVLHARGFHLLSRLLAAIDGRQYRFVITANSEAVTAALRTDEDGAIHVTISEDLLASEAGVEQLSEELARLAI